MSKQRAPERLHPIAKEARTFAKNTVARFPKEFADQPKRCRALILEQLQIELPKGRPGRRSNPDVIKATKIARTADQAGKPRPWKKIFQQCIRGDLTPEQRAKKQRMLRARVRARLSRLKRGTIRKANRAGK